LNIPLSLTNSRRQCHWKLKSLFGNAPALFDRSFRPALRNHALHGTLAGYRSIDVTEDYRAVFRKTVTGGQALIVFHLLGTHKELY
jgi:mRNA-degrading endonuclease YafQ of YafQ-DinJ toxin-antitoxin module